MTDPELALDRTLHHLRTTPVPDGFEHRLLNRLAAHSAPARTSAPAPRYIGWGGLRRALLPATLTVVGMVFLFGVTLRSKPPQGPAAEHRPTVALGQSLPAAPTEPHDQVSSPPMPLARRIIHSAPASPTQPGDIDLALAETNAPTQLAPPLSLTDDERALQHLAQRSSPDVINALDPSRRSAQQAEEEAAFRTFFTPPTIPEHLLRGESD